MGILGITGYAGSKSVLKLYVNYILPHSQKITKAFDDWNYPTSAMRPFVFKEKTFYKIGHTNNIILFFGDSNAEQYAPRIEKLVQLSQSKKSVVFATMGGLCPIPHVGRSIKEMSFVADAMEYANKKEVREIVITGQWIGYLSGRAESYLYQSDEKQGNLSEHVILDKAINDLKKLIIKLVAQGKKVYLISNIPSGKNFDPKSFFRRNFLGKWHIILNHEKKRDWKSQYSKVDMILHDVVKNTGSTIIDPENFLCNENICYTYHIDGTPLYKDGGHLTSTYVSQHITFLDFLFK